MAIPPEKAAMAPFLQGWLAMELMTEAKDANKVVNIVDVKIDTDESGTYSDTLIVVFESGAQVSVQVRPHDPDAEVNDAIKSIRGG